MKKKLLAVLSLLGVLSFAAAFGSCNNDGGNNDNGGNGGTEIEASWDLSGKSTAEVGETLDFSLAAALFGEEVLTPAIAISIDGGEAFAVNGTSYVAGKTGVYTITYTVTYGGKTYTQTETITVRDTQKPTLTKKSGDLPLRAEYGDEIELPVYAAQDNLDGAVTPVIKVYKNDAGKTEIQTQDGGFTVEDYCGYTVEVTAIDSSGNEAKLTETLTVRQEREAEFFENSAYLEQTVYGAGGGIAEYNADRNYVIQGTGSMKFYTTVNGKWISMRVGGIAGLLASQTEEEKSAVKELTFFVYNASPYRANIDFAVFPVSGSEKIVKRTATQNGVWTKISVPYSDVVTAYNENAGAQFGIFFNGGDHAADNAYAQFEAYFDCFRLTFNKDAAPSAKLNVSDVKSKYEQGATVQFADESAFNHVQTDALKITVKDEAGKTVAYDKTADGKYTIASAAGRYTVNYVYADGDDVSAFMQSISVYLPKEHPEIEGFEESAGDTSFEKLRSSNNTVEITSEKAHSGEKSLKIQNHADVRWGATVLRLDPDMLDLLTEKTVLTFYTYIDSDKKNANISSFNTRMATYNPDSTDGLKIGSYLNTNANNVATDTWLKHEIYGEKLMQVKQTGGIVLYNEIVCASEGDYAGNCNYTFYADDFAVENRYESAIFFDSAAEVERISVTNGEVLSKSYANGGAFIQNGLWQAYTYFKIDLGNGFTEASKGKSQIKIRLKLDRFECNATSFNVRFYSYKEGNAEGGQGTHLLQVNGISLNEWIEIVIPADKISAITENALWFDIEEVNASTYWNWKLTIESVTMSATPAAESPAE